MQIPAAILILLYVFSVSVKESKKQNEELTTELCV